MQKIKIFIFLFLVCLAIYANVIDGQFILDDYPLIVHNQYIKHLRFIPLLFITNLSRFEFHYPQAYYYYRPLQTLSYALDYSIYKLNPVGFHLTNILIHAINAFLVFYLLYRLFCHYQLALLTSLLFCVHPIQTETVSFISCRSELLVSLFILLSLVFYLGYLNSKKGLKYFVSVMSFICALLSREAGFLIFIPLFILIAGLKSKFPRKQVWLHSFSFAGIIAIYLILRLTVLVPVEYLPYSSLSFFLDFLNLIYILTEYIQLLIFPYPLYVPRMIKPIISFWSLYALAPLIFLISLIIILIVLMRQKKNILLFGITWFILSLLHLIRFMHKVTDTLTMEEHWVYLPSVGFFIVLAWLLLNIPIKRMGRLVAVFIIIIFCILTVTNNFRWKDEIDFYRYNLRFVESKFSTTLRIGLITALNERGAYDEAIGEIKALLAINPNNWIAYVKLGDTLKAMEKYPEAEEAYRNALSIDPFCWQANRGLKLLAEKPGQLYREEVDPMLSPIEAEVLSLLKVGEFNKALDILYHELSILPSPQLYTLAGIALGKMGKYPQAIDAFNAALKLDPQNLKALYNLSVVYERMRQFKKVDEIQKMIEKIR